MNVLVHNAGLWPTTRIMTEDGLELAFCVNYLAQYILTQELASVLEKNGPDARIVFLSGRI
jgi:NAD(P)-dependent dehydrogenase (short-subunit alcohol dehydrogenase family)